MSYDSAWKEGITRHLRAFFEFFFPAIAADIDWSHPPQFRDKELRSLVRAARLGGSEADVLVEVRRLDGQKTWVLVHIEVQSQVDERFQERMFVYNYRAFDRHRPLPVCSLAILGDTTPDWRPSSFESGIWGCQSRLDFPIFKLLDLRPRMAELARSRNPFAILTEAHFYAKASGPRSDRRLQYKLQLYRRLLHSGFPKDEVASMLRLVEWVLHLSEKASEKFDLEAEKLEREVEMREVTTAFERIGIKRGVQQGLQQGLQEGRQEGLHQGLQEGRQEGLRQSTLRILEKRFGPVPEDVVSALTATTDPALLEELNLGAACEPSLEALRAMLPGQRSPNGS